MRGVPSRYHRDQTRSRRERTGEEVRVDEAVDAASFGEAVFEGELRL